jgi:hypothetical protein
LGFTDAQWLSLSQTIRLEHECTHYATRRLFGSMQNNLLDELLADFFGLTAAVGHFPAAWFLRFLGLDAWPACRQDGRIHTYRGNPPLSDRAFVVLQALIHDCAWTLEELSAHFHVKRDDLPLRARLLMALASCRLEDLARPDGVGFLGGRVASP